MSAPIETPAQRSGERGKGPVDLRLLRLAGRHRRQLLWLIVLSVLRAVTVVATALAGAFTVVLIIRGGSWQAGQIGRASCRERESLAEADGGVRDNDRVLDGER